MAASLASMPLPAVISLSGKGMLTAWNQPPIQCAYVQRSSRPAMSLLTTYDIVGQAALLAFVRAAFRAHDHPLAAG